MIIDTASASPRSVLTVPPARSLKAWGGLSRRDLRIGHWATILDVIPAIGFAAGLAGAVGSLAADARPIGPWLVLAAGSLALRALLGQFAVARGAAAAAQIKAGIRARVLEELFTGRRAGAQGVTGAVEGVEALDGYYSRFSPAKSAAAAAPLILIAAVACASPVSCAILLFTLIPFAVGMALAGMAAAAESRRQFEALARLSGLFLDRIRALPVLISFQAETRAGAEIGRSSTELERRTNKVLKIAFLSSAILEFFAALSVALVAVYCGFNLLRLLPFPVPETLTLSRAFFVLALAPEIYLPLRRLASAYHDRQAAEAAVPELCEAGGSSRAGARPPVKWSWAPVIVFRGVEIRYGDAAPAVVDFDLEVAAGSIVALTGPSGSGKSSLLHLLLGLAPLTRGEVQIGDHALSQVGDFAGMIGWASQAPVVVPGTLGQNIGLARRDASPAEIRMAARHVGLVGDLDRPLDERGGGLSGGERRRLGLARALLSRSRVLLLDEPTANLDGETERELIAILRQAAKGRTILVASHSPAVLAAVDRVVRL